jgi:hypothetical protein
MLHDVLGQHPALHAPKLWELANPVASGLGREPAQQLKQASQAYVDTYYAKAPALPGIHFIGAEIPDECHRLLANTFHSMVLAMRYRIPSYSDWLAGQDLRESYTWHRRQLEALMTAHRDPFDRSPTPVLKDPFHTWFLPSLVSVYPEARFIHLHRDPVDVVPSTASLCRAVRQAASDRIDAPEIGAQWSAAITSLSADLAQNRDQLLGGLPVLDVRYPQLVADPVGTVRSICRFLELDFPEDFAGQVAVRAGRRPGPAPSHRYAPEEFGLSAAGIATATKSYRKRFEV